ncbi:hypothetical protein [Rhodopirellula sp. SWK7]|uniref:hypothetical protein n=1 Tax=Rhodopirellula sp. SWK7 TaxID=595460 RepID=UPI00118188C5|nr:hypothetical protein [Rhodopirellula sp. SWK7]
MKSNTLKFTSLLAFIGCVVCSPVSATEESRPNILFILVDDLAVSNAQENQWTKLGATIENAGEGMGRFLQPVIPTFNASEY